MQAKATCEAMDAGLVGIPRVLMGCKFLLAYLEVAKEHCGL